jgi:hypothetical protein
METLKCASTRKEKIMKKTTLALGLALGISLPSMTFAGGWDYSKHNSREALVFSGQSERPTQVADTSSQSSREALIAHKKDTGKEAGKTTVIYSDRGGETRTSEVAVIR